MTVWSVNWFKGRLDRFWKDIKHTTGEGMSDFSQINQQVIYGLTHRLKNMMMMMMMTSIFQLRLIFLRLLINKAGAESSGGTWYKRALNTRGLKVLQSVAIETQFENSGKLTSNSLGVSVARISASSLVCSRSLTSVIQVDISTIWVSRAWARTIASSNCSTLCLACT